MHHNIAPSITNLVTGTDVLGGAANVHALRDVWALLLDGDDNVAGLVVKTLGNIVIADGGDSLTHNLQHNT